MRIILSAAKEYRKVIAKDALQLLHTILDKNPKNKEILIVSNKLEIIFSLLNSNNLLAWKILLCLLEDNLIAQQTIEAHSLFLKIFQILESYTRKINLNTETSSILSIVLLVLAYTAYNNLINPRMDLKKIISMTVKLLEQHAQNEQVVCAALTVLTNLFEKNPAIQNRIYNAQTLPHYVGLMNSKNPEITKSVRLLLSTTTISDLVELLEKGTETVVTGSLVRLIELTDNYEQLSAIAASGTLPLLFTLFTHPNEVIITKSLQLIAILIKKISFHLSQQQFLNLLQLTESWNCPYQTRPLASRL